MGHELIPSDERINREALERIIHRAAELQAGQREIGEQLTEREVLALGEEVGIPARFMQQAVLEERVRAEIAGGGWLTSFAGAAAVGASRTIPAEPTEVEQALAHWMADAELLIVKRRYPTGMSWEARRDLVASVKRGLGLGGKRYSLSRAKEVAANIRPLEAGWSHVSLTADVSNMRSERLAAGATLAVSGGAATTVGIVPGVATIVAAIPAAAGVALGVAVVRDNLGKVEQVQIALEQVLDRLERSEIKTPKGRPPSEPGDLVKRITAEIRQLGRHWGA